MSHKLRKQAERFVANYYAINVQTARDVFNDEIEAYMQLLEMGLDRVVELLEEQK